ncbi:MAG: hypothetical protein OXH76_05565 [Boseongicola sp.]|nr:hypothetical protein [Boseongicola sp.]
MNMTTPEAALVVGSVLLLAGCVENGTTFPMTVSQEPLDCNDALYEVVQAERAYHDGLAGTDQVREAVLAANRLCGQ